MSPNDTFQRYLPMRLGIGHLFLGILGIQRQAYLGAHGKVLRLSWMDRAGMLCVHAFTLSKA